MEGTVAMKKKISFSSGYLQLHYSPKRALEIAKEAGFDGVDYSLETYGHGPQPNMLEMSQAEFEQHFAEVKKHADELGVEIASTHGQFWGYRPDEAGNEIVRRKALKELEATALLGAKYCVIHSVSTAFWGYDVTPEVIHENNKRLYMDLIPTAEKFGVCVTLESFGNVKLDGVSGYDYFSHHKIMRDEYDGLQTENKAFCVDTGHTNLAVSGGCLSVENFIRYFGNRVKMLHLHDNNGFTDQHLIPGRGGNINWPAVFDALDDIGYEGYYNFEVDLRGLCDSLEKEVMFMGSYLREFVDKRGITKPW